ncbi:hypothetical protein KC874_05200, partial [Candidatus Saccharibacteria bacterium]|nr:hypothetical protein [Candidatus Saccharibacteria bacterium]
INDLKLDNKVTLLLSSRNSKEIPYLDELKTIQANNKNIRIVYVIDSGEAPTGVAQKNVLAGRINKDILLEDFQSNNLTNYYLCGPPPFMIGISSMLSLAGVPDKNIITEAFSQGKNNALNDSRDWPSTVYLAGAFSMLIVGLTIMTPEILKKITPSLLPTSLTASENQSISSRQNELNTLVNELAAATNIASQSPNVEKAYNEVTAAEQKIAEVNAANGTPTTKPSPRAPTSGSSGSTTTNTAPPPVVKAPVCTTSASGVVTCQ